MKAIIKKGQLNGSIKAIASKSYLHRYIIACALADGDSTINFDTSMISNDIEASLSCIESLGASYQINDNDIIIKGIKKKNSVPILNVNESGSTLRFLIPISLCIYDKVIIKLSKRLQERGIDGYNEVFKECNIKVEYFDDKIILSGKLEKDTYTIDASKSSQYVTGLLYASAYLHKDVQINAVGKINSANYIDISLDVLAKLGIKISKIDNSYHIYPSNFRSGEYNIEGDYSNSAFLDAFNYFGSSVEVTNLNPDSLQGDKVYKEYFKILNVKLDTLDINNSIDLGPILFVFAALKHGAKFTGCKRLKIKESNRLDDMIEELAKIGVKAIKENDDDTVIISNTNINNYQDIIFNSHNDHRLAMSLSLVLSMTGGKIEDCDAVNKSYPKFFDDLKDLGLDVEVVK